MKTIVSILFPKLALSYTLDKDYKQEIPEITLKELITTSNKLLARIAGIKGIPNVALKLAIKIS